jgi:hypothetical protein
MNERRHCEQGRYQRTRLFAFIQRIPLPSFTRRRVVGAC